MTAESVTTASTAAATPAAPAAQEEAANNNLMLLPKIDPNTAVQDSIDSLALSLFEALRGVRDAVAPESLEVPGARPNAATAAPGAATATAFLPEADEELGKDATVKERLLNGLNLEYFPPRAFDLLEPDYQAFLMSCLSGDPYAKELLERFNALEGKSNSNASKRSAVSPKSPPSKSTASSNDAALGEVGYEFQKKFDSGWYTGKVTEIRPLAAGGYDRRCVYADGDIEDLRLTDLENLSKLDPNYKKPNSANASDAPNSGSSKSAKKINFPASQSEYTKFLLDSEHQRDVQTTQNLARDILAKSAEVDDLVAKLPGMNRTRQMQMERIEELIKSNHDVTRELEEAYGVARERREEVRVALGESTCLALGVEEDI